MQTYERFGTDSTARREDQKPLVIIHPRGRLDDPTSPMYWAEVPSDSRCYSEGESLDEVIDNVRQQFRAFGGEGLDAKSWAADQLHVELAL
ncbi:MAG: hypothetical protein JRN15_21295 [Nitrososphaerota archaeon]|nr:hypothetical protein [Nitrososphaerota archaeon]